MSPFAPALMSPRPPYRLGRWRTARWPLVMALVAGLLLSLMHCAGCGVALVGNEAVAVATTTDPGSTPDLPDQQLPAHAGHCLSHVAQQAIAAIALPADPVVQAVASAEPRLPRSLAGLPPFKPPRA